MQFQLNKILKRNSRTPSLPKQIICAGLPLVGFLVTFYMENEVEIWRDIPDYEGRYQASTFGNIKTLERICRLGSNTKKIKESILRPSVSGGYRKVSLCKDGRIRYFKINRLVLLTFQGYSGLIADHIDGNKLNDRLDNLQYLTQRENTVKHFSNVRGSGFVGTSFNKKINKWIAFIRIKGEYKHLGVFVNQEDARKARELEESKYEKF